MSNVWCKYVIHFQLSFVPHKQWPEASHRENQLEMTQTYMQKTVNTLRCTLNDMKFCPVYYNAMTSQS